MWALYLVSTHGSNWRSMQQPLYLLLVLVLLLSGLSVWWLVRWLRHTYHNIMRQPTTEPIHTPNIIPTEHRTKHIRLVLGMTLGIVLGWLWRDHQLASNIVPYTDVAIQSKLDNHHYLVQPARMPTMKVILCGSPQVDWLPGDHLRDWIFEQQWGCKRTISYHRKGELDARL